MKNKKQLRDVKTKAKIISPLDALVIPHWEFRMHINGNKEHSLLHRDDKLRIQREIYTPVDKNGFISETKKAKTYYFIDNDPRELRTEEELIKALIANAV